MQVSDFTVILKADFGRFRPVSADFRPVSAVSEVSAAGRYVPIWPIRPDMADTARFWPNQPDSALIEADSARIEPHRRESSRVGANPRKKKKKKNADVVRHAGNRIGRHVSRRAASDAGAAPLVPRPCFLANI